MWTPQSGAELAACLQRAAEQKRSIALAGGGSKRSMAGPVAAADEQISTTGLRRVLEYEARDLTISVEAGLPWSELTRIVSANRQMIPLDPSYAGSATVGGVVAANSNGPRRRLYGTARDLVIGMQFATLAGKLVQSGGMVVKNVAGLDMAKLMIGSFGTLAAITVVNFKLQPAPDVERTFVLPFASAEAAVARRNQILSSALQPAAIDLLNPAAGATLGKSAWLLALWAGGNAAAVDRYERELASHADAVAFEGREQERFWEHVREFTPRFLKTRADGAAVRVSCTLKEVGAVLGSLAGPALARAGSGVCYGYFERAAEAGAWLAESARRGWKAVIEFSPEPWKETADLWPCPEATPGGDLEMMRRVKHLFDPANLLNRGRLYGLI